MDERYNAIQVLIAALEEIGIVKEIDYDKSLTQVTCTFDVKMPSRAKANGISSSGVKTVEPICLQLNELFPNEAPIIKLREDFPRNFPHLNPSDSDEVLPCVYEGNINELYQNSNGPVLFVNQIKDWLNKAAVGDLMDLSQGWEPMRVDQREGFVEISSFYLNELRIKSVETLSQGDVYYSPIFIEKLKNSIFAYQEYKPTLDRDNKPIRFSIFESDDVIDEYFPSSVKTLKDLVSLGQTYGIKNTLELIENIYWNEDQNFASDIVFISFAVQRPVEVINPHYKSKFEYLIFAIYCTEMIGRTKNILFQGSKVVQLYQIEQVNTDLLKSLSDRSSSKNAFCFVGCGSLGSKIALHIAKSGFDDFTLYDPDVFLPHNNARHGLLLPISMYKVTALEILLENVLKRKVYSKNETIINQPLEKLDRKTLIVDTTGSLIVRNNLSLSGSKASIISASLFGHGKLAIILIENDDRTVRVDDLSAYCHALAIKDESFSKYYSLNQISEYRIGLGCSSHTAICSDSDISLSAAGIANKIENLNIYGLDKDGEILYGIVGDDAMSIIWKSIIIKETVVIPSSKDYKMEVRISGNVAAVIEEEFNTNLPNETGGVLLGHISIPMQTIYITSLIEAPDDSIRKPYYFELGTNGLENKIRKIDNLNSPIKALGTWHTHTNPSGPSAKDYETKKKIEASLGKEFTCCLIFSSKGFQRV